MIHIFKSLPGTSIFDVTVDLLQQYIIPKSLPVYCCLRKHFSMDSSQDCLERMDILLAGTQAGVSSLIKNGDSYFYL